MKRLYFVRHGESLWNIKKLCQGRKDIDLSPKGILDAQLFAKSLKDFPITNICSSPLKRALHTAQIIHKAHPHLEIQCYDEFAERGFGEIEGTSSMNIFAIEKQEEDPSFVPGKGVESRHETKNRILKGLEKAFHDYTTPFIVSHGRLFLVLCDLLKIPPIERLNNLALIEITETNGVWSAKSLDPISSVK